MGLVNLALVAALDDGHVRHGRAAARSDDQHGVRLGGGQLEHLAGHAGVRAGKSLGADDFDAAFGRFGAEVFQPAFAVHVVVAEKADRLDALLFHQGEHRVGHHRVRLRHAERPAILARRQRNRRQRQLHGFGLSGHIGNRHRHRRGNRADDDVSLFFSDKTLGIFDAVGRVGGVVQNDELDFFAADAGGPQLHLLVHRNAQAGSRAGQRQAHADGDVGQRGARGQQRKGCGEDCLVQFHDCLFGL